MHHRRLWLSLLAVVLLAIVGPYCALDREAQTLDAPTREALGGNYVTLPGGITHYELSGPADGPLVVLIHGGTIPFFTWDAQIPALRDAGFHVLRYDHFGRGSSDRPQVDYDRAFYQKQLEDLLVALGIEGPVNLVGVSFGGGVAATYAEAHPERVAKLVLIAPVVDYAEGKALFGLAQVPILSDWYARVFSVRATVDRANGFFQESGADPSYAERFDEQTRFEGYEQALLSMSRTDALTSYRDTYAALGDQPTLLLWGSADSEIPREHMEFLRKNLGNVSLVEIEGAGHGVTIQRQEEVNRQLIEFLTNPQPSRN
jgi:pimeloyl-ACP methyl ester carboxylesterase